MNEDFICSSADNQDGLALRVDENTLKAILNASIDSILLTDPHGIILFANKAMEFRLRTPIEKLIGQDIDSFFSPAVACRRRLCVQKAIETTKPCCLIDKRDGIDFESRYFPIFDKKNSIIYIAIFVKDIADRKHKERVVEKNYKKTYDDKKMLESVLDTIPARLFWKDIFGCFLGCNLLFAKDAGYNHPDELIGKSDYDMAWKDQAEMYRRDDAFVMLTGKPKLNYEEPQTTPDGKEIWLSTSKVPLRDENGEIIGVLGAYEDITVRKRYEEQLRITNQELERRVEERTAELQETHKQYLHAEKLSTIGKLSASIAHEFNNPLQGVLSILKGLRKRAIVDQEDRELLEAAIGESDRMKDLIRSLQDFNRPSSNRMVRFDVHQSLDSILLLNKSNFKDKRIEVVRDYAEHLPPIQAVPDQIKQVFLNLVANAADACQHSNGIISVSTRQEGGFVAVAIKDNGIGIKPEDIDHIFEPFFTTKAEVKGTGLGLPVSYGIVKKHQGEIRMKSEPGNGTTFTVLLPIKGSEDISKG